MFERVDNMEELTLSWEQIDNVDRGREHLGKTAPIFIYRMVQYSIREEMKRRYGADEVIAILRKAGEWSGKEFSVHKLDLTLAVDQFIVNLQKSLEENSIGILRIEKIDEETGDILLTISEDLDCSGLPVTGETICHYAEGFLKGVLDQYTGRCYEVREVDCWATGATVCRFEARVIEEEVTK